MTFSPTEQKTQTSLQDNLKFDMEKNANGSGEAHALFFQPPDDGLARLRIVRSA